MDKIIFITGTDTGVGKTLLTVSLVYHLRQRGIDALGMKPFCSGSRYDVKAIQSVQNARLPDDAINPFYFSETVAPLVSAQKHRRKVELKDAIGRIHWVADKCERLVIEGSGGVMVPLGEGYTVADLIAKLSCSVVVVARNRLGTINHTCLTVGELQSRGLPNPKTVLMDGKAADVSSTSNLRVLRHLLAPVPVFNVPFLGPNPLRVSTLRNNHKKIKKVLAQIVD